MANSEPPPAPGDDYDVLFNMINCFTAPEAGRKRPEDFFFFLRDTGCTFRATAGNMVAKVVEIKALVRIRFDWLLWKMKSPTLKLSLEKLSKCPLRRL